MQTTCNFGNCVSYLDERGFIDYGFGPLSCACDHLPSWNKRLAQQHRPTMSRAVKARGRHGSRVQRARQRHRNVDSRGVYLPIERLFS